MDDRSRRFLVVLSATWVLTLIACLVCGERPALTPRDKRLLSAAAVWFCVRVGGFGEGAHVICVALRGEIRIILAAMQRIFGDARAQPSARSIHDRHANTESSKIDAGHDRHIDPAARNRCLRLGKGDQR